METVKPDPLGQDVFLRLLTTQLKHQDPLEPMNGTEFVAQLAQFTQLEQTTGMNQRLQELVDGNVALNQFGVTGLIGKEVKVEGDLVMWSENGAVDLPYLLDAEAAEVVVQISNRNGQIVRTLRPGSQAAGLQSLSWDGRDQDGNALTSGEYLFEVAAKNIEGEAVGVVQYSQGEVSRVSYEEGISYLVVNGQKVPASQIVSVSHSSGIDN